MIRALYTAASGLVAQSAKQDIIANNIANAQTPGFKRLRTSTVSFADELGQMSGILARDGDTRYPKVASPGARIETTDKLDESAGPVQVTGNDYDVAIEGPGEFEVAGSDGKRYTRAGNFHIGPGDELVAADGAKVQGNSGAIRIPKGKLEIKEDGAVVVDGTQIDQIKLSGAKQGETRLRQGQLEGSNVNAVSEMVEMIANMRAFEANQKVVQNVDHSLEKMINEGGKV
jgi:flagellar basal-body rod protein FlgF